MSKALIVAEKPSVAGQIAKALKVSTKKDGWYEGNNVIITWCIGHLVGLSNTEDYDMKYKKWNLNDLPIIPSEYKFKVSENTKKQYGILKKLFTQKDVSEIICATDAGREGELIFRLVYNQTGSKKKIKRLWISSMEDNVIIDGLRNLRPSSDYDNLYKSALARAKADWLIGINATRYYTLNYKSLVSAGRVQTPTLNMIVEKDNSIQNFKTTDFYNLELNMVNFSARSPRIENENIANEFLKIIKNNYTTVKVINMEKSEKKNAPPLLYDLTTLQREANTLLGFTATKTLEIAQKLYEKKLITYPRTDSQYLNSSMEATTLLLLQKIGCKIHTPIRRLLNDGKVQDHHAILPTVSGIETSYNLYGDEEKIFNIIKSKLIACVSKFFVFEETNVTLAFPDSNLPLFTASGKIIKENGFKSEEDNLRKYLNLAVYDKKDIILPNLSKDDEIKYDKASIVKGNTTPPKHFTENTLLSSMERAGNKDIDSNIEVEKKGLGTPATRASIIERLISVGYVERKNKNLISTDKGKQFIDIVNPELKSPRLTAEWENRLALIAKGADSDVDFLHDIEKYIKSIMAC